MKLISKDWIASQALAHFSEQYGPDYGDKGYGFGDTREKHDKLEALGPNPKPSDIEAIIGNKSWTANHCDECRKDCEVTIQLGEEPDWKSSTANICQKCLLDAVELIIDHNLTKVTNDH